MHGDEFIFLESPRYPWDLVFFTQIDAMGLRQTVILSAKEQEKGEARREKRAGEDGENMNTNSTPHLLCAGTVLSPLQTSTEMQPQEAGIVSMFYR